MNVVPGDPMSQYMSPVCDSLHMFVQPCSRQTAHGPATTADAAANSPVCCRLHRTQHFLNADDR